MSYDLVVYSVTLSREGEHSTTYPKNLEKLVLAPDPGQAMLAARVEELGSYRVICLIEVGPLKALDPNFVIRYAESS